MAPGQQSSVTVKTVNCMKNALLQRTQMSLRILHPCTGSIKRQDIANKLAKMYNVKPDVVSIFGMRNVFGGGKTTGTAFIYDSVDSMKKFEPKHRLVKKGLCTITKTSRKQRKERKNRAKKVRGKKKAAVLGKK